MLVFVGGFDGMGGHSHNQAAVLHTFEANNHVGEVLHARSIAVDNEHFKAGIVIKVRMAGGDNQVVMFVLRVGELLGDAEGVVVVDESDSADDRRVGRGGSLAHQPVADEVAKGFGTIGVSTLLDGAVKLFQQVGIEGNTYSA